MNKQLYSLVEFSRDSKEGLTNTHNPAGRKIVRNKKKHKFERKQANTQPNSKNTNNLSKTKHTSIESVYEKVSKAVVKPQQNINTLSNPQPNKECKASQREHTRKQKRIKENGAN